jgi:hypothetical protein
MDKQSTNQTQQMSAQPQTYSVQVVRTPPRDTYDRVALGGSIVLTTVGVVGVLTAVVTLRFLRRQLKEMQRQSKSIYRSSIAADKALAITDKQITLASAQVELMQKQSDIMERTLVLQHRPKIIVRIHYIKTTAVSAINAMPVGNMQFGIANVGGTEATVIDSRFAVNLVNDVGAPMFIDNLGWVEVGTLNAGEAKTHTIELSPYINEVLRRTDQNLNNPGFWGEQKLVRFIGIVRYKDRLGIERSTGICRIYQAQVGRFVPIDDADQEYSD